MPKLNVLPRGITNGQLTPQSPRGFLTTAGAKTNRQEENRKIAQTIRQCQNTSQMNHRIKAELVNIFRFLCQSILQSIIESAIFRYAVLFNSHTCAQQNPVEVFESFLHMEENPTNSSLSKPDNNASIRCVCVVYIYILNFLRIYLLSNVIVAQPLERCSNAS